MEPIDIEKLSNLIPLQRVQDDSPPSLNSSVDDAQDLLDFNVVRDESDTRGTIFIQQTGHGDWWNCLNPRVTVGYKKVGRVEAEPLIPRLSLPCRSMVSL